MNKRQFFSTLGLGLSLGLAALLVAPAAAAQDNTLRLIVPYPAGGGSDIAARVIANELQPRLGVPVIVENVVGAAGRIGVQQLKRMPADANALVLVNPALMVIMPQVLKDAGYNPDTDFVPVTQVSRYEMALAVGTAVPVREVNHLLAWMRANPEKANFGVPATGSIPHFFALMLAQAAGVQVPVIGYRGSAPLANDLMGGHVPVAVDALDSLLPAHEAGRVRVLATSGEKRSVSAIPTLKEAGLNLSASGWNVFYAKASMSPERVARLSRTISEIMNLPTVREKFNAAKVEPVSANQDQTRAMVAAFKQQWVPVIQKSGIKLD